MKKHAQAILLFTGYPLEPIVALQIKKSYQSHLPEVLNQVSATQTQSEHNKRKRNRVKQ